MMYYILSGSSLYNFDYLCRIARRFSIHRARHYNTNIGFRLIKTIKNDKL